MKAGNTGQYTKEGERIEVFRCYECRLELVSENNERSPYPYWRNTCSQCPKCGAPLLVIDKKQPNAQYWGVTLSPRVPELPRNRMYVPPQGQRRRPSDDEEAAEEFAALPAEFFHHNFRYHGFEATRLPIFSLL